MIYALERLSPIETRESITTLSGKIIRRGDYVRGSEDSPFWQRTFEGQVIRISTEDERGIATGEWHLVLSNGVCINVYNIIEVTITPS